jgi:hypothetical protein
MSAANALAGAKQSPCSGADITQIASSLRFFMPSGIAMTDKKHETATPVRGKMNE